jgi:hypothetical protein
LIIVRCLITEVDAAGTDESPAMNLPKSLRRSSIAIILLLICFLGASLNPSGGWDPDRYLLRIPRLEIPPKINGDLSDWKSVAFTDGLWDIARLRHAPWYDPEINRLTNQEGEESAEEDLRSRYYIAWDETYLYLGAEVHDNVNDVKDPQHAPNRWYFKDAVCFFIEAPADQVAEQFGAGDNAFCFVIDPSMPSHGAWWRHGTTTKSFVEEALPRSTVTYSIRMDPWRRGRGDFILEARVAMAPTLGQSDPNWNTPRPGDNYRLQIVHTDPDGGDYGGHILLYGKGDDDSTWARMILTDPIKPIERKPE